MKYSKLPYFFFLFFYVEIPAPQKTYFSLKNLIPNQKYFGGDKIN